MFRSLRQNEDLASSIGIDVARYRVIAFAFCCAMGGIAGAFFAAFHQNIYPASYTVADSINFMLYCFLGGLDFVARADRRRLSAGRSPSSCWAPCSNTRRCSTAC